MVPPRDYHDIFAMLPKQIVKIDGALEPLYRTQYFKDIIATLRCREGDKMTVEFEPLTGRYFKLRSSGHDYRSIWKRQDAEFR